MSNRHDVRLDLSEWQFQWFTEKVELVVEEQKKVWQSSVHDGKMRASEYAMACVELEEILKQIQGAPSMRQSAEAARKVAKDESVAGGSTGS